MLIGRKTRSGLKSVTIFRTIIVNFAPSRARRIFEAPARARACTGSNATLYPALMKASVVVVGVEKPFGSRWRNSRRHESLAPRNPDVRSGIGRPVRYAARPLSAAFPARRPVVHDDNLVPRRRLPERGDDVRDRGSFVVGRDYDRDGRGVGH